jgi:hypothetical protein
VPSIFLFGLTALPLNAGIIQYQVTGLGGSSFRYDYQFSDFTLQAFQEVEISFDPALYSNLRNPAAGSDFGLVLAQPLNPPGTAGFYSILAQVNNPSLAGPFRVEFDYLGGGQPGTQPYALNQFTAGGLFDHTIETGATGVPEPANIALTVTGLLCGLLLLTRRRR